METQVCIECGEEKPLPEYYSHPQMANGYLGVCKGCHKLRMKRRRLTNPRVQEYDRLRDKLPHRIKRRNEYHKKWREKNPDGYRAHYLLTNAVRNGRVKKEPCSLCGTTKRVHGHHRDYTKPLDVVWLCAKCHQRVHATFPELSANPLAGG